MIYSKTNWVDKVTPVNAANMNKIENELAEDDILLEEVNYENYEKKNKDANGQYTEAWEYNSNNVLTRKTVLSNPDATGNYQIETQTYYATDGTTVIATQMFALYYDSDGELYKRTRTQ